MLWCVCKHLHFKEINDKPCQTLRCPIVRKTHMGLSCSIFRHNHILHSLSSLIPNYQVAGFNMSKNRLGICVSCVCVVWVYLYIYIYIYCPAASIARTISLSLQRYLRGVGVKHLSTVRFSSGSNVQYVIKPSVWVWSRLWNILFIYRMIFRIGKWSWRSMFHFQVTQKAIVYALHQQGPPKPFVGGQILLWTAESLIFHHPGMGVLYECSQFTHPKLNKCVNPQSEGRLGPTNPPRSPEVPKKRPRKR